MAANVAWILDHEGPDAKLVTWAHNWHVLKKDAAPGFGRMSTELERLFGDRHLVMGFAFNRGGFLAWGLDHGNPGTSVLQEFVVGPAKAGSIDRAFSEFGPLLFALDLRGLDPAGSWATTAHPLRDVPAGFEPKDEATYYIDSPLAREFDVVIFVEDTTRARPNPAAEPLLGEHASEATIAELKDKHACCTPGAAGACCSKDAKLGECCKGKDCCKDKGDHCCHAAAEQTSKLLEVGARR
jgi:erythromycin esterase